MNYKKNITELVGHTPLLQIKENLFAKLEMFNPAGSVKDRIALNMILTAQQAGVLKPGYKIIEATSGNTGIGLAAMGTALGYEVIIVMPSTMSVERQKLIKAYGATLILTDGSLGMKGAIAKVQELVADDETYFWASQFENMANPATHLSYTGEEIYQDLDGQVDIVVAGVGTGGTISGIGRYLKAKKPEVQMVAVEPSASAVLSGQQPGKHKIQGIGAGFIPSTLDTQIYSSVQQVSDDEAFAAAKAFGHQFGLLIGISAGAAYSAALKLADMPENQNKNIVVIFPDGGDRYLSTTLYE